MCLKSLTYKFSCYIQISRKNRNSILTFIIYFSNLCLKFTFGTLNFHKLSPRTCNLRSWYHHAFQHQFDPKNLHDLSNNPELYLPIIQRTHGYIIVEMVPITPACTNIYFYEIPEMIFFLQCQILQDFDPLGHIYFSWN